MLFAIGFPVFLRELTWKDVRACGALVTYRQSNKNKTLPRPADSARLGVVCVFLKVIVMRVASYVFSNRVRVKATLGFSDVYYQAFKDFYHCYTETNRNKQTFMTIQVQAETSFYLFILFALFVGHLSPSNKGTLLLVKRIKLKTDTR